MCHCNGIDPMTGEVARNGDRGYEDDAGRPDSLVDLSGARGGAGLPVFLVEASRLAVVPRLSPSGSSPACCSSSCRASSAL
jgi:hypothetical protein